MSTSTRVRHALDKFETERVADPRTTVFDVTAERTDATVRLAGTVATADLKARAVESVRAVAGEPVDAAGVAVLADEARPLTITDPVAAVRGAPSEDAEQVTQLLYGADLRGFDTEGENGPSETSM